MLKDVSKHLFLLTFMAFMTVSMTAQAEGEIVPISVGVVDVQAVMQKSAAGKHIQKQLDKKRKEYQKQISAKEDSLRAAEKKIVSQKADLSEKEFNQKREEFEKEVVAAQKMVQKNKRSLDAGFSKGLSTLRDEIRETISTVAAERKYAMVVSKDAVIIAAKDMDLTDEVIKALDKRIKKVDLDWSVK
jgi:outer membrane protein